MCTSLAQTQKITRRIHRHFVVLSDVRYFDGHLAQQVAMPFFTSYRKHGCGHTCRACLHASFVEHPTLRSLTGYANFDSEDHLITARSHIIPKTW